jgi:hypothetical protein
MIIFCRKDKGAHQPNLQILESLKKLASYQLPSLFYHSTLTLTPQINVTKTFFFITDLPGQ